MTDSTFQDVTQPDAGITDPLHELLRKGARDLIAKAVEAELTTFLEQFAGVCQHSWHMKWFRLFKTLLPVAPAPARDSGAPPLAS